MTDVDLGRHGVKTRRRRPGRDIVLAGLVLGWLVLLRPTTLGGPAGYIAVAGTSMEPTLHTGDLVLTQRADAYQVGDVVAYRAGGGIVIHRIVGGDARSGFVVRGDNRGQPDLWRPTPGEIIGRAWLQLPLAGEMLGRLGRSIVPAGFAATAVFLAVMGIPRRRSAVPAEPTGPASRSAAGSS